MVDDILRILLANLERGKEHPFIISGSVGAGKTSVCKRLVCKLRSDRVKVGGVLSPRDVLSGRTIGYEIVDLKSGKKRDFARLNPPGIPVGRYYLNKESLGWAKRSIQNSLDVADVLFIDEVGRLEIMGGGFAPAVEKSLSASSIPVLLVRSRFVRDVRRAFGIEEYDLKRIEPYNGDED